MTATYCLVMAHAHRVFLRSDDPGGPTQRHVLVHQNTPTPHKQHQHIFSLHLQEETEGSKRLNRIDPFLTILVSMVTLLENVQHCGGEPEQAATMATHE